MTNKIDAVAVLREALEQLENGALNVAGNAKLRNDKYDEGYANAMAACARQALTATEHIAATERAAIQPAGEAVAWLIEWKGPDGTKYQEVFRHNAVGDYRYIDEDATATELVRLAAPISEATGKGEAIYQAQMAAAPAWNDVSKSTYEQARLGHYKARIVFLAPAAARTPAIVGSIATDEQFKLLLAKYFVSDEDTEAMACERAIFAYIDARATKMEAAPTGASK